jgi:hypothetical protein
MTTTLILRMDTGLKGLSFVSSVALLNAFFTRRGLSALEGLDLYSLGGNEGSPDNYTAFGMYQEIDTEAFVKWAQSFNWKNDGGVVELISFEDGKATEVHTIRGEKQFQLLSWYAVDGDADSPDGEQTCALAEGTELDGRAYNDRTECGQYITLRTGSPTGWPTCRECSASLLKKMREGKL